MEESLVMRRPKRSTAGNRMEAALAEFKAEELGQDIEEDNDFVVAVDEQDAFESDFESTDEEGAQADVDASAEKMVIEEERRSRKTGRSQLEKVTAAAHVRQKATFHPELANTDTPKAKMKRRVSMGVVVDAETGAVVESTSTKRHSQRSHTMLNTSMTDLRIKDEMVKKSTLPRRTRVKIRPPTQDELIARALDMEDGNIKEHKNYLQLEEEKRKRARLVRTAVEGPLLRWVSKAEKVTVAVEPEPAPVPVPPLIPAPQYAYAYSSTSQLPTGYSQLPTYVPTPGTSYYHPPQPPGSEKSTASSSQVTFIHYGQSTASAVPVPARSPVAPQIHIQPIMLAPQVPVAPAGLVERIETVAKSYVVHETAQEEGTAKPLWKETMAAMFGDHVKWEELKVYVGKGRPTSRPQDICLITGQRAKYKDPRSGVPYADARAFQILTKILSHDFVWSETLGCYISSREDGNKVHSGPENSVSPSQ